MLNGDFHSAKQSSGAFLPILRDSEFFLLANRILPSQNSEAKNKILIFSWGPQLKKADLGEKTVEFGFFKAKLSYFIKN